MNEIFSHSCTATPAAGFSFHRTRPWALPKPAAGLTAVPVWERSAEVLAVSGAAAFAAVLPLLEEAGADVVSDPELQPERVPARTTAPAAPASDMRWDSLCFIGLQPLRRIIGGNAPCAYCS